MKVLFNSIPVGTRFVYMDKHYEKTGMAKSGCCNKSFNAFCIDTEEPRVFSRKDQVEVPDEKQ